MKNTVQIPKFLHEFHGARSNWEDITSIHVLAFFTTVICLVLANDSALQLWQKCLLGVLAYDLAGGVMANFSYATNLYYDASQKRRLVFLSLHFLQPIALMLVFPDYYAGVLIFSGLIIASSFMVNAVKNPQRQLIMGVLFSVMGCILVLSTGLYLTPVLQLLLVVFFIKLPFAFSIRWYRIEKFKAI